ncbi:hypothetical protein [Chryseobacterium sp. G0201]|uniref:hypothetical protein n=1 Tax=Chryseobacterium sp. G0201 TaxID=2487065 RepID=UPI000F4FBE01|nr:hypothetical protein [Chryseobacterium sp. G0201]AZA54520.1 hypothetical protein EG348_16745 [Chryseobacterium sp. G0201]
MNHQQKYYQLTETIDPKIIGRGELPLTVEIKDKTFIEQSGDYMMNFNRYFDEKEKLYENFPKNLIGKMYQKKKLPIDIMAVMPYHPIIHFIISEKVKNIFEKLKINKSEYHLEKLNIEGSNSPFYFLFIPILKDSEHINFQNSVFRDSFNDKDRIFGNYETYQTEDKAGHFGAKSIYVSSKLENQDIIKIQTVKAYFSERIIETFKQEAVIGYDIIDRGKYKVDLNFDN